MGRFPAMLYTCYGYHVVRPEKRLLFFFKIAKECQKKIEYIIYRSVRDET